MKKNYSVSGIIILGVILSFCLISFLPFRFNEKIKNSAIDLQFKMRGDRVFADDMFIVFISTEDIKAMNRWPITRDYHGYLLHILHQLGAKVIGIDLLFEDADEQYPEFDKLFADFILEAGNVCLPMIFMEFTVEKDGVKRHTHNCLKAQEPLYPDDIFRTAAAGSGFSNLGSDVNLYRVPLAAQSNGHLVLSFGGELARLYLGAHHASIQAATLVLADSSGKKYRIPIDDCGRIYPNHFKDIHRLQSISYLDLLRQYENAPESLNIQGKIVLVAVTAPGKANMVATPLNSVLPASFIHATVAENIIHQNYLRQVSIYIQWLIIALIAALVILLSLIKPKIVGYPVGILLYWMLALVLFNKSNMVIPLFYPSIIYLVTIAIIESQRLHQRRTHETTIKTLLEQQVELKENQLNEAREKLAEMQQQLEQEVTVTEETRQIAEERKQSILLLEKELNDLQNYIVSEKQETQAEFTNIVHAKTSKMAQVLHLVVKVSTDDIPVLIMGETGTGKEMIARAIHQSSMRRNKPFVAVNCGALPETLLDSELFGHEKGSFTGAHSRRKGRFELANGGTIFLDEVTETTPTFQTRLLRVLQEGAFERLGGEQTITVDVRIIAATNKDVYEEMVKQRFRSDLFYRLNGFPITIPPLRERIEDIPLLAIHFLKKYEYQTVSAFSGQAMAILQSYHWTGNVRELENVVRRAAIMAQSEGRSIIRESDLPEEVTTGKLRQVFRLLEDQILENLRTLQFSRSAISQTAKMFGNRDRGTITEYFRGICFEHLVHAEFNMDNAARTIAASTDEEVVARVKAKIEEYVNNLRTTQTDADITENDVQKMASPYKGLPKKFHPYLNKIFEEMINRG